MIHRKPFDSIVANLSAYIYRREKARIPAWCDRILRRGSNLKQLSYDSANLHFSDHRPVYATFQCTVSCIDEARKDKLSKEVYFKRRAEVGFGNGHTPDYLDEEEEEESEEDLLLLGDEPTLAPGSKETLTLVKFSQAPIPLYTHFFSSLLTQHAI